jgi:hypothetical protein
MRENLKKGCAGAVLVVVVGFLVYFYLASGNARRICDNLLRESLLNSREQCHISIDPDEYIPAMFPLGVSREYVE